MQISIITPVFNLIRSDRTEAFLRMLASLKAQTFRDFEHIVIDGASTDGTVEMLQELHRTGQITKVHSEPDTGIYQALNRGLERAEGEYFMVLPSDDFYHGADGLAAISETIKRARRPDIVASPVLFLRDPPVIYKASRFPRALFFSMPCPHLGMAMKTELVRSIGGFDESFRIAGDYDLLLRLLLQGRHLRICDSNFASFSAGGVSTDATLSLQEMRISLRQNLEKTLGRPLGIPDWDDAPRDPIPLAVLLRMLVSPRIGSIVKLVAAYRAAEIVTPGYFRRFVPIRHSRNVMSDIKSSDKG